MKAHKFEPVAVVCDDCGEVLAETYGTPYMEGTIVIRPELIRTHDCPGKSMRAELEAIRASFRGEPASDPGPGWERLDNCACTGVGLRIKLAALTGKVEHAPECKTNAPRDVRPAPLWHDGYCLSHGERECEWCRP